MSNTTRLVMAQLNFLVGDIPGNAQKIIDAISAAREEHKAQLIVFPELALTGYPLEDLLFRADLYERIALVLPKIQAAAQGIDVILGYPENWQQAALIRPPLSDLVKFCAIIINRNYLIIVSLMKGVIFGRELLLALSISRTCL